MSLRKALDDASSIIRNLSKLYKEHRNVILEEAALLEMTEGEVNVKYLRGETLPTRLYKSLVYLEAYGQLIEVNNKPVEETVYE